MNLQRDWLGEEEPLSSHTRTEPGWPKGGFKSIQLEYRRALRLGRGGGWASIEEEHLAEAQWAMSWTDMVSKGEEWAPVGGGGLGSPRGGSPRGRRGSSRRGPSGRGVPEAEGLQGVPRERRGFRGTGVPGGGGLRQSGKQPSRPFTGSVLQLPALCEVGLWGISVALSTLGVLPLEVGGGGRQWKQRCLQISPFQPSHGHLQPLTCL